jgi:hypothetical protein
MSLSPITAGAAIPGTITFSVDNQALPAAVLSSGGTAGPIPIGPLSIGEHTVSSLYSGDTNYISSADNWPNQVVKKAGTTLQITSSGKTLTLITYTATVNVNAPGTGMPTGTIQFRNGLVLLGPPVMVVSGRASINYTLSSPHEKLDTNADYSGDGNFTPSSANLAGLLYKIVLPFIKGGTRP